MPRRPCADQSAIPWPTPLGVGGGVDADVPMADADIGLEGSLLGRVEHVAAREQEHDGVVRTEACCAEDGVVLGCGDDEAILCSEAAQGLDRGRNRLVAEALGLGEHEDARVRWLCGARCARCPAVRRR